MPFKIILEDDAMLDWPEQEEDLMTGKVQCVGSGFLNYFVAQQNGAKHVFRSDSSMMFDDDDDDDDDNDNDKDDNDKNEEVEQIDLFELTEAQLDALNYYQVLHLPFSGRTTADDVKKAYRKACLKYHPDKSGRGEEDAVFLKVKAAFETLSTQREAYDSTEMPFDESIPPSDEPDDFFAVYAPVFERNLYYDARLQQQQKKNNNTSNNKRRKSKNNNNQAIKPPYLGDSSTSIEDVHRFYDYWTHFSTWRDFTLQASKELETQDHLEQAESRYEKRWYQKEIDKRAKKLKQQEQARITLLVERAMQHDPRLIQERLRLIQEKEEKQRLREQQGREEKERAIQAKLDEEKRLQMEKEQRQQEKLQREKEKKQLRKIKQAFRKFIAGFLEQTNQGEHVMEDQVDLICKTYQKQQLVDLNQYFKNNTQMAAAEKLKLVDQRAKDIESGVLPQTNGDGTPAPDPVILPTEPEVVKIESTVTAAPKPFAKQELSALAKGVKKFPPGGANRWDQIANYINNVCKNADPRTKEQCIETYNQIAKGPARNTENNKDNNNGTEATTSRNTNSNNATTDGQTTTTAITTTTSDDADVWTEEQDQKLQDGLSQFPASMDKNERWTSIAKCVPGKTKKQCVQRFKAIRDAIRNKQ